MDYSPVNQLGTANRQNTVSRPREIGLLRPRDTGGKMDVTESAKYCVMLGVKTDQLKSVAF